MATDNRNTLTTDERVGKALAVAQAEQQRAPVAISQEAGGLLIQNADQAKAVASAMAASGVAVRPFMRNNLGTCLAVVIQAVEWRMSPFAVAAKAYSVNDQLAYESQLIQAVIYKRAPIKGRMRFSYEGEGQERRCTVRAYLNDEMSVEPGDYVEIETPRLRDIKPQNSPLWKNDPDQQLSYYGGRVLCRRYFPDVLLGTYDEDEIDRNRPPAPAPGQRRVVDRGSVSDRLDRLAAPVQEAAPGPVIDHEKEMKGLDVMRDSGVISDQDYHQQRAERIAEEKARTDQAAGGEGSTDGVVDESEPDDADFPGDQMTPAQQRRADVLATLRSAATDGGKALDAAAGKLSEEEVAMVTADEQRGIRAIADEIDQRAGKRGGTKR